MEVAESPNTILRRAVTTYMKKKGYFPSEKHSIQFTYILSSL